MRYLGFRRRRPPHRRFIAAGAARLGAAVGLVLFSGLAALADWPTYRGSPTRAGSTDQQIQTPLQAGWIYRAPAAPRMAWSSAEGRVMEEKLIGHRTKYDDAIHPVVVGDRVYFGSSVDHQLHCLELTSGEEIWSFFSGGPIRLAPTVDQQRVYFGSDDGFAYCLDAADGRVVWKRRAGPADEWLLARGEMISRWPVRTGVLVDDGVAYFGAGIFPHEDIYLYAVDAADGSIRWRQDNLSVQDAGRNDLSPQGYLLASDELLFVPSGRSLPAAVDRQSGQLVHKRTFPWRTTAGGVVGGVQALLADGQMYASGPHHWLAMEQTRGDVGFGWFAGREMVVQGDAAYVATGEAVARLNRLEYAVNSRKRHKLELEIYTAKRQLSGAAKKKREELQGKIAEAEVELQRIAQIGIDWQQPTEDHAALLATPDLVFVGGESRVSARAAEGGEVVWEAEVDGQARGLVLAADHLLVSTDSGRIYSFASASLPSSHRDAQPREGQQRGDNDAPRWAADEVSPFAEDEWSERYAQAAEEILDAGGTRRGFCLIVGNEKGRLAWELARRSEMMIYAVEPNAQKVQAARQTFSAAGLYGHRIVVHQADSDQLPYSNYFADLIASDAFLRTGRLPDAADALAPHLKPLGGAIVLARPTEGPGEADDTADAAAIDRWFQRTGLLDQATQTTTDRLHQLTRGALPGAADWTHQYGNPANTAVSEERRVEGGLGVLWYGDPGPGEMVNRHEGAVGPLAVNGRLVVQGEDSILAYDAYNGTFLWKHENPEAIRTGVFQNHNPANLAASENRLFHFLKDQCIELDAATGEVVRVHRLPEEKDNGQYEWGYVATSDGILFGAATTRKELEARQRRRGRQTDDATDALFAIDLATGQHLWSYQGQSISHHTIAIGGDHIYFIDSSLTSEQRAALLREDKSRLAELTGKEREIAEQRAKEADIRRAVALEARSGEQRWATAVDVTDCSDIGIGGGKLTLMYKDNVLILGGANANGHYWKQFIDGEFDRRRLVALSATGGYKLWDRDANYKLRPIIIGQQVFAEPWAFDLQTGQQRTRQHPLTGEEVPWSLMRTGHHCGMFTGCESGMLLFRSGDTAFYNLERDAGIRHFAGHRLGCWINAIPANGLVMIPEASAGCVCLFSIASTIVMEPREARREWGIHSAYGAQTPVRSMAINLGAPGDRKDSRGTLWLSYPRRTAYKETSLDVALDLQPRFAAGGGYQGVSESAAEIAGAEEPWLYTSWAEGLERLTLPLLGPDDDPATYRVRLHFAAAESEATAMEVRLQGESVLENLQLKPAAAGVSAAEVHEVEGVQVTDDLVVELRATQGAGVLHAIEVIQSD